MINFNNERIFELVQELNLSGYPTEELLKDLIATFVNLAETEFEKDDNNMVVKYNALCLLRDAETLLK
jgi:hypothetical protein